LNGTIDKVSGSDKVGVVLEVTPLTAKETSA
jgi:predicted amino acid-binding ACT domain protein